jgi:hypothetical protein
LDCRNETAHNGAGLKISYSPVRSNQRNAEVAMKRFSIVSIAILTLALGLTTASASPHAHCATPGFVLMLGVGY